MHHHESYISASSVGHSDRPYTVSFCRTAAIAVKTIPLREADQGVEMPIAGRDRRRKPFRYRDEEVRLREAKDLDYSPLLDACRHSGRPIVRSQPRMIVVVAAKLATRRLNPRAGVLLRAAHKCAEVEIAKRSRKTDKRPIAHDRSIHSCGSLGDPAGRCYPARELAGRMSLLMTVPIQASKRLPRWTHRPRTVPSTRNPHASATLREASFPTCARQPTPISPTSLKAQFRTWASDRRMTCRPGPTPRGRSQPRPSRLPGTVDRPFLRIVLRVPPRTRPSHRSASLGRHERGTLVRRLRRTGQEPWSSVDSPDPDSGQLCQQYHLRHGASGSDRHRQTVAEGPWAAARNDHCLPGEPATGTFRREARGGRRRQASDETTIPVANRHVGQGGVGMSTSLPIGLNPTFRNALSDLAFPGEMAANTKPPAGTSVRASRINEGPTCWPWRVGRTSAESSVLPAGPWASVTKPRWSPKTCTSSRSARAWRTRG